MCISKLFRTCVIRSKAHISACGTGVVSAATLPVFNVCTLVEQLDCCRNKVCSSALTSFSCFLSAVGELMASAPHFARPSQRPKLFNVSNIAGG